MANRAPAARARLYRISYRRGPGVTYKEAYRLIVGLLADLWSFPNGL